MEGVTFMLVVVVATMADYEALTHRLFFGNNNVRRFRTFAIPRSSINLRSLTTVPSSSVTVG